MSTESPLGRPAAYPDRYAPEVLHGIPRSSGRAELGIEGKPPFTGVDIWNAWELSWLNERGKPVAATAQLWIPATSLNLIESKSLKLYFDSLHSMRHASLASIETLIATDLGRVAGGDVGVALSSSSDAAPAMGAVPEGTSLDGLDIAIDTYKPDPRLLSNGTEPGTEVSETLYSHLFKSNCPVTGQPDWATVFVRYRGARIDRAALLRYLVSFRNHAAFHEHCVERIFVDLRQRCAPRALTVHARYTRRGGLDINPFRSDFEEAPDNVRTWRQ